MSAASVATHLDALASARYAKAGGELAAQVNDDATAALAAAVVAQANGLAGWNDEAEGDRALNLAGGRGHPCWCAKASERLTYRPRPRAGPSENARRRAALEELLAVAEAYGDLGFSLAAHRNLPRRLLRQRPPGLSAHVERQVELDPELGQVKSRSERTTASASFSFSKVIPAGR